MKNIATAKNSIFNIAFNNTYKKDTSEICFTMFGEATMRMLYTCTIKACHSKNYHKCVLVSNFI